LGAIEAPPRGKWRTSGAAGRETATVVNARRRTWFPAKRARHETPVFQGETSLDLRRSAPRPAIMFCLDTGGNEVWDGAAFLKIIARCRTVGP
jgi:hypothetical protein